jgi:hypothetical protein
VRFEDLVDRARRATAPSRPVAVDRRRLGDVLLRAAAGSLVELHSCPPRLARRAGERPVASSLARHQVARGQDIVTSLRHRSVRIEDPLAAWLLGRLDGTRDRAALLADVRGVEAPGVAAPPVDELPEALDRALQRLARLGLLQE